MTEKPPYNLEKYCENTEIVHLTAKQISKDFAMFGVRISFSGNTAFAYSELMVQLIENISALLQNDRERLFALMYQIDIGQASVNEGLCMHDSPAPFLADLIIRREMMKVLSVQYFKNKKKQK